MGASSREIEREIKETRQRMDENLTRLESRAVNNASRYGRWALLGVGALAAAGIAFMVYRRSRRPALRERLDDLSVERIRDLLERIKAELPSVTVRINETTQEEPGVVEGILRRVAPAVAGTVSTAILERMSRGQESEPA